MNYCKWIVLGMLLCLVGLSSCKKGCNNPKAYNFQPSAKENDGSCLFCDSTTYMYNSQSDYVTDYNQASPYYYQTVIITSAVQNRVYYTGNGCKLLGKINADNTTGCNNFSYLLLINNRTSKTITYSGTITVSPYNIAALTYHASNLVIPPYGTDSVFMGSACSIYTSYNITSTTESLQYQ